MTSDLDQLDRMIDALNDKRDPEREGFVDADLAELVELARGLKSLGHTRWPDETFPSRAAAKLATTLAPAPSNGRGSRRIDDDVVEELPQLPPLSMINDDHLPVPLVSRRSRTRKSLEIAAAVAVLILFSGLVAMLLRGSGAGAPTPTIQAGQGSNVGAGASVGQISGMIDPVNTAGNGRYLHLVKSDGGISVTVEWAGTTFDRVMVLMTFASNGKAFGIARSSENALRAVSGAVGIINPYTMTMRASDGTTLPEMGAVCGQAECLAQFDRTPIVGRSGDIRLHAEISGLLTGSNASAGATPRVVSTPDVAASFAFDFSLPAWSNSEASGTTQPSPMSTPTAPVSTASPPVVSDPTLTSLQQAAGFKLLAPASLPDGLTLEQPQPPLSLDGGITSVVLKYVDGSGKEALSITEASPYQDSAQSMPLDVWNHATRVEIQSDGYGRVTARLYQSDSDIQMWWEVARTSIRLESGGAPGTAMLTKDQVMNVALSMMPVGTTVTSVVATPSDAFGLSKDQAVTKARGVVANLGGNTQAEATSVQLGPLSDQTALGMPQPNGLDPNAPVWVVTFNDALAPQGCPDAGTSVCSHGQLVVVLDAKTGRILGFHKDDGVWQ